MFVGNTNHQSLLTSTCTHAHSALLDQTLRPSLKTDGAGLLQFHVNTNDAYQTYAETRKLSADFDFQDDFSNQGRIREYSFVSITILRDDALRFSLSKGRHRSDTSPE
jgi:hypothetical protein